MTDSDTPEAPFQNWRATLAYDGTDFRGWQVQPGQPTIQGELQAALGRVTGEQPLPQGSGRTDAGVHALAQVASFALRAPIPPASLHRALNRTLPESIRVLDVRTAPTAFHARHSALAKTYEYRVFLERPDGAHEPAAICPPFLARYAYPCSWPLDSTALQEAARLFVGEHDFTSFAAVDPDLASRSREEESDNEPLTAVRTISTSDWERRETEAGQLLVYRVRGNGFLHHMVRNLVGTMIDVGRGYLGPETIPGILAARNRSAAGPTAPARGLFLHSVEYDNADDTRTVERGAESDSLLP
jgi:tRNA pseudouridine38-40 synthase